eukprot:gene5688-biopygen7488
MRPLPSFVRSVDVAVEVGDALPLDQELEGADDGEAGEHRPVREQA